MAGIFFLQGCEDSRQPRICEKGHHCHHDICTSTNININHQDYVMEFNHHNRNSSNPPQGRWMAHWVVMAFFNASDSILSPMFIWYNSCLVAWVSDNLVSIFIACARKTALQYDKKMLRWVPGFNEARFLLLLYLVLPITRYRHVQFQSP